jgi:uncharacterized protein with ACT and thioredoxin-like domain
VAGQPGSGGNGGICSVAKAASINGRHRHRYQRISVAAYGIIGENNQRGVWRQMASSGNMKAAAKMAAGSLSGLA